METWFKTWYFLDALLNLGIEQPWKVGVARNEQRHTATHSDTQRYTTKTTSDYLHKSAETMTHSDKQRHTATQRHIGTAKRLVEDTTAHWPNDT